jgi:membrane-bound ClpP family serine protease
MKNMRLIIAVLSSLLDEALILGLLLWGLPKLGIDIPIPVIVILMVIFALYAITTFRLGTRILKLKPLAGLTDMTSMEGRVVKTLNPAGLVRIGGEIWKAQSAIGTVEAGVDVIVLAQNGLKLTVKRKNYKENSSQ